MKKVFLVFSVAALALMACTSESVEYVGSGPEAKEIAFSPLAQRITRAAVDGTTFPTTSSMQVAAYDVTNSRDFFTHTTFTHDSEANWKGGKYWPLSPTYINFLAYTGFNGQASDATDETTGATWDIVSNATSEEASGVVLVMEDNSSNQKDLMYAIGNGEVTQAGNTLTFPINVPMAFNHAQAWIDFYVKANSSTETAITINSITLTGAKYSGTYTITHANYNQNSSQSVSGAWSLLGSQVNPTVPGWSATALTTSFVQVGNGLLIVPDDNSSTADWTSFTINYTQGGKTYNFVYTPATASDANVDQAKHYVFNINFTLREIVIAASVSDWTDVNTNVSVQ